MKVLYIDEAGTSAPERFTVVVGVIIDKREVDRVRRELLEINRAYAPPLYAEDFLFHASDLYNARKFTEWPIAERIQIIHEYCALPSRFNYAVIVGKVRRDADPEGPIGKNFYHFDKQHLHAFGECICGADSYLRECYSAETRCRIVAERVPKLKRELGIILRHYQDNEHHISPEHLRPTREDQLSGAIRQRTIRTVSRIQGSIKFVPKDDDSVLQVADACAFGFRRFFNNMRDGCDLAESIVGYRLHLEDWMGPVSMGIFSKRLPRAPVSTQREPESRYTPRPWL